MWSRLGRCALLAIVIITSLAWTPHARAQQSAPFPSNPLPTNAELNYLVEGDFDSDIDEDAHLIFERFDLKSGQSLPTESGPQILIAVSGSLETIDDLGLTATLSAGDRLFAPAGTVNELAAASDARILRARIGSSSSTAAAPATALHEIEILEGRCDPTTLTIRLGDSLAIINSTDREQVFTAHSIDLDLSIDPGDRTEVVLGDIPTGNWVASCGVRAGSGSPISTVSLIVESPLKSLITQKQSTTPEVVPGQTILLDAPLEDIEQLTTSVLYVAKVTLSGKSNTGEQLFSGATGIVSSSQPLSLIRSGRLPASLPAASSVLLPADATVTIENAAVAPTEFFVVGLVSANQNTASADDANTGDDERPTARDSDATPTSPPTPQPTARTASPEPDDYSELIPTIADVTSLGFSLVGSEERPFYSDSLLETFIPSKTEAGWITGQLVGYSSRNGSINVAVTIDEFVSAEAARTMIDTMDNETASWGIAVDPPQRDNASAVTAHALDITESRQTGTQITGQFGRFLVTVLVLTPIYTDGMPTAIDFWEIINATQD